MHITNSTDVVSSSQVDSGIILELDDARDLSVGKVHLESIVNADVWMWESEGSSVVSGNVWDLLLANVLLDDLAKLEASLLGINSVWVESSLHIEKDSEELVGFFNSNNVHLTKRESVLSSYLSVDLDEALLLFNNLNTFLSAHGVIEPLLQQNVQWDALSQLVWTRFRSSTVHSF